MSEKIELQVRMADQAMYHQGNQSVFVGGRLWTLLPPPAVVKIEMKLWPQNRSFPCNSEKEYETQAAISKFYICADVSHTHTRRQGGARKHDIHEDEDERGVKVR